MDSNGEIGHNWKNIIGLNLQILSISMNFILSQLQENRESPVISAILNMYPLTKYLNSPKLTNNINYYEI